VNRRAWVLGYYCRLCDWRDADWRWSICPKCGAEPRLAHMLIESTSVWWKPWTWCRYRIIDWKPRS